MADLINACFEFFAVFALANHCRVLYRQKQVRGVSIMSVVFFSAWGFWNLYYYPSLGQMFSFYAGVLLCLIHAIYIYLLIKYKNN